MIYTKGAVLRSTQDFVRAEGGDAALARVLQRLPVETRSVVQNAAPTDEIPIALAYTLWQAADEELAPNDPQWVERAGAHSIESVGVQLYGGIVRKPTPADFLRQPVSLFRLFYHAGGMEVIEREATRAVLRLVGFDEPNALFCRRQTGGLRRVLEIAGGANPAVRHVRCAVEGDAFCEWEMTWG